MNKSDIMKAAELAQERMENMSVGEQGINELYRNAQALIAAAALLKQVEELQEALRFYSNPSDYLAPLTGGLGKLYYDCGATAQKALTGERP